MNTIAKLLTAIAIGVAAALAASSVMGGPLFNPVLIALFCAATVITAFVTGSAAKPASESIPEVAAGDSDRENGTVKWFNVTKGFGFVIRESGEEIFVHFRSIRGEGRRGLRDGQAVSFVVAETDKGPQAEDVEPL